MLDEQKLWNTIQKMGEDIADLDRNVADMRQEQGETRELAYSMSAALVQTGVNLEQGCSNLKKAISAMSNEYPKHDFTELWASFDPIDQCSKAIAAFLPEVQKSRRSHGAPSQSQQQGQRQGQPAGMR